MSKNELMWRSKGEEALAIGWTALAAFSPVHWLAVVAGICAVLSGLGAIALAIVASRAPS